MTEEDPEEFCSPLSLPGIGWWHLPLPRQRGSSGTHPSRRMGIGEEIAVIRPIDPGDDYTYYSAPHSAIAKKPMEVLFFRKLQTRVVFVLDLAPGMAFGDPRKQAIAVKVLVSLATSVIVQPADGAVTIIAAGGTVLRKDDIGNVMELRAFIRTLLSLPPRERRDSGLPETIDEASRIPESLICVLSDFIITERDKEWIDIASACDQCISADSEVIFVRVLDTLESSFRSRGSVTISAPGGGAVWTSAATARAVDRRNRAIRQTIGSIIEEPDIRFCEVVSQDHNLSDSLHDFLRERLYYLRQYMPNLPFTR